MRWFATAATLQILLVSVLLAGRLPPASNFKPTTIRPTTVVPLVSPALPHRVAVFHPPGKPLNIVAFDTKRALFEAIPAQDAESPRFWVEPEHLPVDPPFDFPRDKDIEVEIPGEPAASYVLYLPPNYSTDSPPPLVFAFPPYGRGGRFIQPLKQPSKRLGWVLVGCNGLSNGRNEIFFPTAEAIMRDVRRRVPHDRGREILLGFSGGAMGAYRLSRVFWDEFAGVVALGGWLGVYDEHLVYPDRLVVAMLNGDRDAGAREYEAGDRRILGRFGVTSKVFRFDGGHTIPPRQTLNKAFDWMISQWKGRSEASDDPERLLRAALASLEDGRLDQALESSLDLILEHGYSPQAGAAEELLVRLLVDSPSGHKYRLRPREPESAHVLYGKARGASSVPSRTVAYLEAGLLLAPDDGLIQSRLAFELFQLDKSSRRARDLAAQSLRTAPNHWLSHFVSGLLRDADGRRDEAIEAIRQARRLAPNALQPLCTGILQSWGVQ